MRIIVAATFLVFVLVDAGLVAEEQTTYRIGNSLTWDSQPLAIEQLASQRGLKHREGYHINCGQSLQRIWTHPDEVCVEPVEDFGRFQQALMEHRWSAVVLQPYPAGESTLKLDTARILDFIRLARKNEANSETVFYIYAAWPHRPKKTFRQAWEQPTADEDSTRTTLAQSYFDHLLDRVRRATPADVRMIPVGHVLAELDRQMRAGKVPGFQRADQLYRDDAHLTLDVGRYLAGITTFTTLFSQNPAGMTKPEAHYGKESAFSRPLYHAIHAAVWDVSTRRAAQTGVHAQGRSAMEYHVSPQGSDENPGSSSSPFKTISAAACLAQPGDVITVHEGTYRERISPPRGGESDTKRIVYQAAAGEKVVIKGSEPITGWRKAQNDTFQVSIPNGFFKGFNPYADLIRGDWFAPKGRNHHTGAVYLNGHWLTEAATLEDALKPIGDTPVWFAEVDESSTTIWAQFDGIDPNDADVEINVRRTVFYPEKPGINYITVRGFAMMHAATPWAPPTAEQIGLVGTHWSKGWIIENNDIRYSTCVGVTLGKYGDEFDNTSQNSAEGYVKTIERALADGWSREKIGHHVVRNNRISHCEQAGIVGSLGAVFSRIIGNDIHDIHVRQLFSGAEMAGIKLHAAIDTEISRNRIRRTCLGIWLDWMTQGTLVVGNLLYDNKAAYGDLLVEVNHGPFLVANNLSLSPKAVFDMSQGGAYVHNLFTGSFAVHTELKRDTPFLQPHSTEVAGLRNIAGGDDRFYNNIFVHPAGLSDYNNAAQPMRMAGNVFLDGASPGKAEQDPLALPEFDPEIKLVEEEDGILLHLVLDKAWAEERRRELVTTELLGKAAVPELPYESPDGSPCRIDADYFGRKRSTTNPFPGPFELPTGGQQVLKVWPVTEPRQRHRGAARGLRCLAAVTR